MRIGLEEIDPHIAQMLKERLCVPLTEFLKEDIAWGGFFSLWKLDTRELKMKRRRDPSPDEKQAYQLRKKRDEKIAIRASLACFFASVGAFVGVGVAQSPDLLTAGIVTGTLGCLTGATAGGWWTYQATPQRELAREVSLEEMRAVFPLLSLTRAERIYCDTLLLLARLETTPETETRMRETLRELSALLQSSRQLEAHRQALLPLMGQNVIKELEDEYGELGRRLDATKDPIARETMQRSLQMVSTRIENARSLRQNLERILAQQEAVTQTLSSATSALARMQLSAGTHTEFVVQDISQTVAQINQQTYAVEKAVEEVLTLRTQ